MASTWPILLVTLGSYIAIGLATRPMLPLFAVIVLVMLIPTLLGARVYLDISDALFHKIVLGLLSLSGVALEVSVAPRLLA